MKDVKGRILEAGVGTGRILIPMLQKGLLVDGVDISEAMLDQCRQHMETYGVDGTLYHQNLLQLSLPHTYGAIVMPTGSFCLLDRQVIQKVLTSFYDPLDSHGKLVIDLEMPSSFHQGDVSVDHFKFSDTTGILYTSISETMDWLEQKTSYISRYEWLEKGDVLETEVSNFTLYWYGIEEFKMRLQSVGFTDIEVELGYGTGASNIVTFIAYKR